MKSFYHIIFQIFFPKLVFDIRPFTFWIHHFILFKKLQFVLRTTPTLHTCVSHKNLWFLSTLTVSYKFMADQDVKFISGCMWWRGRWCSLFCCCLYSISISKRCIQMLQILKIIYLELLENRTQSYIAIFNFTFIVIAGVMVTSGREIMTVASKSWETGQNMLGCDKTNSC